MRLNKKRFTVSAAPLQEFEKVDLVATAHLPLGGIGDDATVLICWPGGSYTKDYWDFPEDSYNFCEHMSARGYLAISVDPLGVGESTRPAKGDDVGLELMAIVAARFTDGIRASLRDGSFDPLVAPVQGFRIVGIGHSMGAILVTVQQGLAASYDAVALLGTSVRYRDTSRDGDPAAMSVTDLMRSPAAEHVRGRSLGDSWDEEYVLYDRAMLQGGLLALHLPDVPTAIIEADNAREGAWPRRPLVEAGCGYHGRFASQIAVPVFLGSSVMDLAADPRSEVQHYSGCSDISLFVIENSAHCHNFSTDRRVLWDRIARWL